MCKMVTALCLVLANLPLIAVRQLGSAHAQGVFCFQFDTDEGGRSAAEAFKVLCLLDSRHSSTFVQMHHRQPLASRRPVSTSDQINL